ncbi:pyridoxal phosphate-dependent aminotransferase [Kitasatospora sp. NBC_00315]|uniref:pyridoxal phosphate-dependent aminotransferase n=1 Tax=Kitasatospora sp. NBC_00315 TaxID=2975963 RepID=UPI0032437EB4
MTARPPAPTGRPPVPTGRPPVPIGRPPDTAAAARLLGGSAFALSARAGRLEARGHDVVRLEVGQPDLCGPPAAIEAATRELARGHAGYTDAAGDPQVREQVAAHYAARLGRPVTADQVVLLPGSNLALWFTLLTVLSPGDEVLLPDPGFPPYAELVRLAGGRPVGYPLRPERDHVPDPGEVAGLVTARTRVLVVNSPHNPTGSVWPAQCLAALAALARRHRLHTVTDEAYRELSEPGLDTPLYPADERTVVMDSLSKSHSMCGWRIGIAIVPPPLLRRFTDLLVNTNCCMPQFVQRAVPAALADTGHVRAARAEYADRRALLVRELGALPGVLVRRPLGGLYVLADVRGTGAGTDDRRLAETLLDEALVATAPGSLFGGHGAGHLRLSLTQPAPRLAEGVSRLRTFLEDL